MYPELFTKSGGERDDSYSARGAFQKTWGGYEETYHLAQGDIRRFSEISEMTMHKCYLYLAHNVSKTKLENQEARARNFKASNK